MPFPEFDSAKRKLLFFTRGRGSGHAVPDMEIVQRLQKLRSDVDVRFVSYSTGARTLEEHDQPLIDVNLPENGSLADMAVGAGRLIGWLMPDVVVSHEEFTVPLAASIFHRPNVFLTDWFDPEARLEMSALKFATRILFIGFEGIFPEPEWLAGNVEYVGPVLRAFRYGPDDRERAREELHIPQDAILVAMLPGNWTEQRAPSLELVEGAFDLLSGARKHLYWVAGEDHAVLHERFARRRDVTVLQRDWQIDRLMVAADVAITKTNRKTVIDLCHFRVPSVALSRGLSPIDDRVVGSLDGVTLFDTIGASPETLAAVLETALAGDRAALATIPASSAARCAERLSQSLDESVKSQAARASQ